MLSSCLITASKLDEVDKSLIFIYEVQRYLTKVDKLKVQLFRPEFLAAEKLLLSHFGWDLNFVLAHDILELYLANGVLFSDETELLKHLTFS